MFRVWLECTKLHFSIWNLHADRYALIHNHPTSVHTNGSRNYSQTPLIRPSLIRLYCNPAIIGQEQIFPY